MVLRWDTPGEMGVSGCKVIWWYHTKCFQLYNSNSAMNLVLAIFNVDYRCCVNWLHNESVKATIGKSWIFILGNPKFRDWSRLVLISKICIFQSKSKEVGKMSEIEWFLLITKWCTIIRWQWQVPFSSTFLFNFRKGSGKMIFRSNIKKN